MNEVLLQYGWFKWTSCSCGGTFKAKYKHPSKPGTQIHIKPNRNTWEHKVSNSTVERGTGSQSLEAKLKEI